MPCFPKHAANHACVLTAAWVQPVSTRNLRPKPWPRLYLQTTMSGAPDAPDTGPLLLQQCTLRPWCLADAPSLVAQLNDREVWRWVRNRIPHPYTLQDAQNFLEVASERQATAFAVWPRQLHPADCWPGLRRSISGKRCRWQTHMPSPPCFAAKEGPVEVLAIEVDGQAVGAVGVHPQGDVYERSGTVVASLKQQ
jgi:RimJ/RimL family protein N-acetyltransferase